MDYSTVLSSASRLKKNSLYKVTIAEACKDILLQLNTLVTDGYDAGLTCVEFKLPINFRRIDNVVTNKELQTAIYYNIITELERKDYDVKLRFEQKYTLMKVSWAVKADTKEIMRMQDKIMSLREA
jgi:hypothetical protein